MPFSLRLTIQVAAVHSWVARSRSGRIDWGAVGASMAPPLPAAPAHALWRCVAYGAAQASFLQRRVDGVCGGPSQAALPRHTPWAHSLH